MEATRPMSSFSSFGSTDSSGKNTALFELLSPDGYYTYLRIPKHTAAAAAADSAFPSASPATRVTTIDQELVTKNYRKLSLKHHPDRRGGDAETFRVLNRAKRVLLNAKLRQQYDLVGLDLEDDEDDEEEDSAAAQEATNSNDNNNHSAAQDEAKGGGVESVVSAMASATLAVILQTAVRTAMMAAVATFLVRYLVTVVPAFLFLVFVAYRVFESWRMKVPGSSVGHVAAPLLIGLGIIAMYRGRRGTTEENDDNDAVALWSWTFFIGESMVMGLFTYNSLTHPVSPPATIAVATSSCIFAWILRGSIWRYPLLLLMEGVVAFLAAMVFPFMEMVLDEVLKQKLKKVGEKVRQHTQQTRMYYQAQHEVKLQAIYQNYPEAREVIEKEEDGGGGGR